MKVKFINVCFSRPIAMRGNLEGLNDEGDVVENYKVVKRLIGHQSGI